MPEKLSHSPERRHYKQSPEIKTKPHSREKLPLDKEKESRKQEKRAEKARHKAEKLALKSKEHLPANEETEPHEPVATRGIKKQNYNATMNRIESRLPSYQRVFSKFIRSESVDKISTAVGSTVARPSGMLGAGVVALFGLAAMVYFANEIGFSLSGTEFIVFVLLGWFAGIVIEIIIRNLRNLKG